MRSREVQHLMMSCPFDWLSSRSVGVKSKGIQGRQSWNVGKPAGMRPTRRRLVEPSSAPTPLLLRLPVSPVRSAVATIVNHANPARATVHCKSNCRWSCRLSCGLRQLRPTHRVVRPSRVRGSLGSSSRRDPRHKWCIVLTRNDDIAPNWSSAVPGHRI